MPKQNGLHRLFQNEEHILKKPYPLHNVSGPVRVYSQVISFILSEGITLEDTTTENGLATVIYISFVGSFISCVCTT